jgi:serine O-acetyltransferase
VNNQQLKLLKRWLERFWVFSPERLWFLSIHMTDRGHWLVAFWIKQLNTLLYHNSLSPAATVGPDIRLGHNSIGIVITGNVAIGRGVKIWHNVTLTAGRPAPAAAPAASGDDGQTAQSAPMPDGAPLPEDMPTPAELPRSADSPNPAPGRSQIIVEDYVRIGANSVIIAPRGKTLRVGRGARIGAGTVITKDVPARATVVGQPPRVLVKKSAPHQAEGSPEPDPARAAKRRAPARGREGDA